MKCPSCGKDDHGVTGTDSDYDETIERWRKCRACKHSWLTHETEKPPTIPDTIPLAKP